MGIIGFPGCEKDDICVDGDAPLLIIRFYDQANPENTKEVTTLRVVGVGQASTVNTFADRSTADSLAIPLRPGSLSTTFVLISNSKDVDELEAGNSDTLTFNHETNEVFVSRACGFIASYENLSTSLTADSDNWIDTIEITNPIVENTFEAHVKIFH